jgi:hypothetical protein
LVAPTAADDETREQIQDHGHIMLPAFADDELEGIAYASPIRSLGRKLATRRFAPTGGS